MFQLERLSKQRIILKVEHPQTQVQACAPERLTSAHLFRAEGASPNCRAWLFP